MGNHQSSSRSKRHGSGQADGRAPRSASLTLKLRPRLLHRQRHQVREVESDSCSTSSSSSSSSSSDSSISSGRSVNGRSIARDVGSETDGCIGYRAHDGDCGGGSCSCSSMTVVDRECDCGEFGVPLEVSSRGALPREKEDYAAGDELVVQEQEEEILMLTLPENDECWLTQNTSLQQQQQQQQAPAPPPPDSGAVALPQEQPSCCPEASQAATSTQQQQKQEQQEEEPPEPKQDPPVVTQPAALDPGPPTVISRTVFVPQNWTSVIFFVKGTEAEAVARQCRVDLSISCSSVDCSKREKEVLGTAKKRAVHIRAANVEDAACAVEQLLAFMAVMISPPDLPERSWVAAATAAGAAAVSTSDGTPAITPGPSSSAASAAGYSLAAGDQQQKSATASQESSTKIHPLTGGPISSAPQCHDTDNRTYCSRRQLNESRSAVLEIDVENTSAGLLPFLPGSCDRRGLMVSARSGCTFEITDRIRRRPAGEERRVVKVHGPSLLALEKCVRLMELHFPSVGARAHFRDMRERLDVNGKQLRFA